MKEIELPVQGMTCANCAQSIERRLTKLGAEQVRVNLSSHTVKFTPTSKLDRTEAEGAIKKLGFTVLDTKDSEHSHHHAHDTHGDESNVEKKFIISAILTAPLLLAMFLPFSLLHNPIFQLCLTVPVLGISLSHFGRSALGSLRSGVPNMDVLIMVGVLSAFFYSLAGMLLGLGPEYLFFETAASITCFVLLGNVIEHRSVKRTTSAISELASLQVSTAKIVRPGVGKEIISEVDSREVQSGDIVQVNTGDRIPVDGVVISGTALINEAVITGESAPVERNPEETVVGGTVLEEGSLRIRATAIGEESVLAGIIRLVKEAEEKRPSIQRLGDKVSSYFVPSVIIFSVATFLVTQFVLGLGFQESLLRSIAVLVIACPCAMGLATPTAVAVALGRAAKLGILVKGGQTFEALSEVQEFIFDKTGTLTTGDFSVTVESLNDATVTEVKSTLVALEKSSSHPIAQSIVKAFPDVPPLEVKDVTEEKGIGLEGSDSDGNKFVIRGNRGEIAASTPESDLVLLKNDIPIGLVHLSDRIKDDSRAVVQSLRDRGMKTTLLSGDAKKKVEKTAGELGIDTYYGETSPARKVSILEEHERLHPTAYVGDGINDGPVLSRAQVGISLSDATQVAIESAQVVLLGGNLSRLVDAHAMSLLTLRVIKQNLFWAFFYNTLAIPLAACGYLSPMLAAFTMAFSDVIVIGNSLRLKRLSLK